MKPSSEAVVPAVGALLVVAIVFGWALRLPGLSESLWHDEGFTWLQTRDLSVLRTLELTSQDTYPPLHNLLTLPFLALFGKSEVSYRLPALVLGVLSIPASYWLGVLASGRKVGILAAILMALAPFAISYSQEARMYALFMLAASLYGASVLTWLENPSWQRSLGVVAAGSIVLYSHPYGAFVLASAGVGGLIAISLDRGGWRKAAVFASLCTVIAGSYAPWLFYTLNVARDLVADGFWIKRPSVIGAFGQLRHITGGWFGFLLLAGGWILASLPFRAPEEADDRRRWRRAVAILLSLGFGPLAIGFAISQITTPVLIARYLIGSLPALVVLAAMGYGKLGKASLLPPIVLVGTLMAPAVAETHYPRHGEDWRSLAQYLRENVVGTDCVLLLVPHQAPALRYYGFEPPECFDTAIRDMAKRAPVAGRLFAIVSHSVKRMRQVKEKLPGRWSPLHLAGTINVQVRAPVAP